MMATYISSSPASLFQCESGNTTWVFLEERLLGKASVYTADITPKEPMGWKNCCYLLICTKQGQFTNAHTFNRILSLEGILEKQTMVETKEVTYYVPGVHSKFTSTLQFTAGILSKSLVLVQLELLLLFLMLIVSFFLNQTFSKIKPYTTLNIYSHFYRPISQSMDLDMDQKTTIQQLSRMPIQPQNHHRTGLSKPVPGGTG